jgi:hypothetical protein
MKQMKVADETLRRLEADTYQREARKIKQIQRRMECVFEIAVDPKTFLLSIWCILQGVDLGEMTEVGD